MPDEIPPIETPTARPPGLRERGRERTREGIRATAPRLFAERIAEPWERRPHDALGQTAPGAVAGAFRP